MNKEQAKKELNALVEKGEYIYFSSIVDYDKDFYKNSDEITQKFSKVANEKFKYPKEAYYSWYHNAHRIVRLFAHEHLENFERFYTGSKHVKKTDDLDNMTAGITHYIQGWSIERSYKTIDFFHTFITGFTAQRNILKAIAENVDNVLFNLESQIQYGFSKSEIEVAKELQKNKHLRAAGAVAGVVIEVHLRTVATNRKISVPKTSKISIYNEKLKGKVYDATMTKRVELCANIRNKCAHASDNPPTDDEIDTIISSAEIIIATVN